MKCITSVDGSGGASDLLLYNLWNSSVENGHVFFCASSRIVEVEMTSQVTMKIQTAY